MDQNNNSYLELEKSVEHLMNAFNNILFLTPEELDHLESIYRYYIITDNGKSSLNLNDDLSFDSFYSKSKEYVLNKYGPSLPYKITPLEQIQLITDFNQYIRIKYVKEYVTLLW